MHSYMHSFTHSHTCIPAYTNRWRQRARPPQSSRARALQPSCDDCLCCLRLLSHMLQPTFFHAFDNSDREDGQGQPVRVTHAHLRESVHRGGTAEGTRQHLAHVLVMVDSLSLSLKRTSERLAMVSSFSPAGSWACFKFITLLGHAWGLCMKGFAVTQVVIC